MRRQALEYLACPRCRSTLDMDPATAVDEASDGHLMSGVLVCRINGCRYRIDGGVPALLSSAVDSRSTNNASRFDQQWKHWRELNVRYERQFLDWIAPVTREDFAGRLVLEGGCGKGRHSAVVASFGPKALVAVDLGESTAVAFQNTRHLPNVHVVRGDLLQPPVGPVFDVAFSVGVLHHLPDPGEGFRQLASRVREGGRVVIWVYGRENNEWIVRYVDPLRRALTSRLSAPALRVLSFAPAAVVWGATKLGYGRLGKPLQKRLPYADYLAGLREFPFFEIHNIVFDQLVPTVAFYLPQAEVRSWFQRGFQQVEVRWKEAYSWTGVGIVRRIDPRD
jgi:SAM-dependent methyltransferase